MIKKILIVFSILISMISLCGCHGSKGNKEFEIVDDFDDSKEYEIVFWAKNDTNKYQIEVYENAKTEFEKIYPNIHVTIKYYTDYKRIYNDVITNISTKTTPNICITYPDHVATYLTGENVVVPLNELMFDDEYGLGGSKIKFDSPTYDEMISEFMDECLIDDNYYLLPFMRSTECVYINKTLVNKLGYEVPDILTWDWIWEVSEAATLKNEDGTYVLNDSKEMIPFIYKSVDNMMIQMTEQLNSGYSNSKGEINLFNETTKDILLEINDHISSGAFNIFALVSYPGNYLNIGHCLFGIDSTAGATWMGPDAPNVDIDRNDMVDFEMVVRAIPQYDINNPKIISQGPSICIFNKEDSNEVMASWLFVQYLLSNDVQLAYSETEGYLPVTNKALNSDEYQDYLNREGEDNDVHYSIKIEATKILLNNIENTFTTPVFNGSASLRTAAGSLIESVAFGIQRKKTINSEYIDQMYSETISLYRLDQLGDSGISDVTKEELPIASRILLISLVVVWGMIGLYILIEKKKNNKRA